MHGLMKKSLLKGDETETERKQQELLLVLFLVQWFPGGRKINLRGLHDYRKDRKAEKYTSFSFLKL